MDIMKDHFINLLNSLTNLSPSRNLISQYILLLPKDAATAYHSYPELSTENAKNLLQNFFGIKFDGYVVRDKDSFSDTLYKYLHALFDWLDDEEIRSEIAKVLDLPINSIPNPYEEWARKVLEKLSKMPEGGKILKFLKMFTEKESFEIHKDTIYRVWEPFINEAKEKLKLNPVEADEIFKLTVLSPNIPAESRGEFLSAGIYASEIIRTFYHSEYHLDLIIGVYICDSLYYSYVLRHKKTIRKLLEDITRDREEI